MIKENRNQPLPGQNYSFYFTAEQRINWAACSRPDINAIAVSCCNRGLVNPYPMQSDPRQSAIAHKSIWQFQISPWAVCAQE